MLKRVEAFAHTREQAVAGTAAKRQNGTIYSMADLFAGCGGLSLGFEQAGFTPVFVNELNRDALATYLLNRFHSVGGLGFAGNPHLRCDDANLLEGSRLESLKRDLAGIPEVSLRFDKGAGQESGAGSTLDVITGGPPCQGFSEIGHRRSHRVDKNEYPSNRLYIRMASIIRELRPRLFLFENVKGLLHARWTKCGGSKIWPEVLAEYRGIPGYEVRWSLVHASDYGVPQNRPRVLMVGIRKDILQSCEWLDPGADQEDALRCGFLPSPDGIEPPPHLVDLLGDIVDPHVTEMLRSGGFERGAFETTRYPSVAKTPVQWMLRRSPAHRPSGEAVQLTEQEYSKHGPAIVAKFAYMLENGGRIPSYMRTKKFSQRLLPAKWDERGPLITVTCLPDDYVHFSQPRTLTVREWARLQFFPDWYRFAGKRTTGGLRRAGNPREGLFDREAPKYTQVGNAVPVRLAEQVGRHFRRILDSALA